MCVLPVLAQNHAWIVGGKGNGSAAAATNAGVYLQGTTNWADAQSANGGPLAVVDGVDVVNNGGNVQLRSGGSAYADAVIGVGVRCDFLQDENTDGIYLVLSIESVDWITIDLAFVGDGETANTDVGGALLNPGDVPDTDDFIDGLRMGDGEIHKVWIRAIADYATEDESLSILYINQAGTVGAPIIWEGHFAEITNEKGDHGIVTFNASGKTNAIETAVGGSVYHTFIGFSLENATDDGANLNGSIDDYVTFIRCRATLNGVNGIQGDRFIWLVFCDLDNNTSIGFDGGSRNTALFSVFRNNGLRGFNADMSTVIGCLSHDNSTRQIQVNGTGSLVIGCTVDSSLVASSIGIWQDSPVSAPWAAINNIITDNVTGIQDDSVARQAAMLSNNLYNSNTTDAHANIYPQPVDGDIWGNVKDPTNLFSSGYILHADNKGKGIDASFTKAYWDDFNGGAGDNPPNPLSGLSFMDMGSFQREEAVSGGGGGVVGVGWN